jgi:predicted amidohydrolase YtcJ
VLSVQPARSTQHAHDDVEATVAGTDGTLDGAANSAAIATAYGSDWPAAPMDPRLAVQATVMDADAPEDPAREDSNAASVALRRALDAYTSGSAWASFDENRKGTLAPGMLADIVVLSTDVFALPPSRLLDAHVTMTIFDGQIVYERQDGGTD